MCDILVLIKGTRYTGLKKISFPLHFLQSNGFIYTYISWWLKNGPTKGTSLRWLDIQLQISIIGMTFQAPPIFQWHRQSRRRLVVCVDWSFLWKPSYPQLANYPQIIKNIYPSLTACNQFLETIQNPFYIYIFSFHSFLYSIFIFPRK